MGVVGAEDGGCHGCGGGEGGGGERDGGCEGGEDEGGQVLEMHSVCVWRSLVLLLTGFLGFYSLGRTALVCVVQKQHGSISIYTMRILVKAILQAACFERCNKQ